MKIFPFGYSNCWKKKKRIERKKEGKRERI